MVSEEPRPGHTDRDAPARAFLRRHAVRVCYISLERRQDRWQAAERHAVEELFAKVPWRRQGVEPLEEGSVEFCMGGGVDAHAHKELLAESGLEAVEAVMNCKVYRDWPICDEYDVARIVRDTSSNGAQPSGDADIVLSAAEGSKLWLEYESWFRQKWYSRLSRQYCDYFNRHTTLGEMGSGLAHFEVAQRAAKPLGEGGADFLVVFEDDARPTCDTLPVLFEQVDALEKHGLKWDLIYLYSKKYDKDPEMPAGMPDEAADDNSVTAKVDAGAAELVLLKAKHRKVCAAYVLSRRGICRIAASSFRESVFAYDDFLPALHSEHPRPDVMQLPCVKEARDGLGQDEGFAAFTFPDDFGVCVLSSEAAAVSDNNRSPCVVGDHGVED
eukprot:TRINITY_DN37673_c0_g1_i2.p1 TRINITY_DN37673_c0_g1~~TRINITY_DN37673_c0_g1_i2.p1  ORF type:complete len:385 (-),score=43.10 TRINITY_DN37673_c0_g1_i2:549-1703(-)